MKSLPTDPRQYNLLDLLERDPCEKNHGGNEESQAAFDSIKCDTAIIRARIADFIKSKGHLGATCDEIEFALNLSHQTASARCSELRKNPKYQISPTYFKRTTRSGRSAAVLVYWGVK